MNKLARAVFSVVAVAASLAVALPVRAQETSQQSDLVLFGAASNPGGFVGFISAIESNPTESFPAFLPAQPFIPNEGVQLYEDAGLTIVSDQLWVQNGFWYFASDPNLVNLAGLGIPVVASIVENGTPQDMSAFFSLPAGSMQVQSDVIPEPGTFMLVGLSVAGLLAIIRRRKA